MKGAEIVDDRKDGGFYKCRAAFKVIGIRWTKGIDPAQMAGEGASN